MNIETMITIASICVTILISSGWLISSLKKKNIAAETKAFESEYIKNTVETQGILAQNVKEPSITDISDAYEKLLKSHLGLVENMERRLKSLENEVKKLKEENEKFKKDNKTLKTVNKTLQKQIDTLNNK